MDCQRPYGYNQRNRGNQRPCQNPNHPHMNDGCRDKNEHMEHFPLAMGFVRMQPWGKLYEPCEALMEGTAFPDLNKKFCGVRRG